MAFTKGDTDDELFFDIPELDTHEFDNYDGFSTYPAVGHFLSNYIYATTHHLISISSSIAAIIPALCTIASLFQYCINGLSWRNCHVDVKKLHNFLLFKPDNIVIKILEATTQLCDFNEHLPMKQYNKIFPYSGPHWHKDDAIDTFLFSVKAHNSTTAAKIIVGANTLLTDGYCIRSKSGLDISKVLQCRFHNHGIPINIWSDNTQEEFMGSVRKLLRAYVVGSKQYEAHKQNQNPDERRIQEIKCTTCTVLDSSGTPSFSWIICMAYSVSILSCMAHFSLSWCTTHEAEYGFTPDVAHLMEFELWEPILILDDKTQFTD